MKISGIYIIKNIVTNEIYVGSSKDVHHRKISHFSKMKRGIHENFRIQKSLRKYGVDNFIFIVIEEVDREDHLIEREQFWIDTLKPQFNILSKAGGHTIGITYDLLEKYRRHGDVLRGRKMPAEAVEKLRQRMIRAWSDPKYKERLAPTPERKKRISDGTAKYLYIFISPTGEEVEVRSVNRFSREMGLSPNWMQHVAQGKRKSNAGWTLKEKIYVGYKKDRQ